MSNLLKKHSLTIAGVLLGLLGGYLYWYFIGCANGTCMIQASPWRMTPYGGLMGGLLGNLAQDYYNRRKAKQS